jgi:hypothetical protein
LEAVRNRNVQNSSLAVSQADPPETRASPAFPKLPMEMPGLPFLFQQERCKFHRECRQVPAFRVRRLRAFTLESKRPIGFALTHRPPDPLGNPPAVPSLQDTVAIVGSLPNSITH